MNVIVTANHVPFMQGGAEIHISGLVENLRQAGVNVECIRFPFRFSPLEDISSLMEFCESRDLNRPNGIRVDKVISLQFPAWGVLHDNQRTWVMHQHRAVYELYEQQDKTPGLASLKQAITEFDNRALARAEKLFANSGRVAGRIKQYNGLQARPLYHPPAQEARFYCQEAYDYIFCPSRLERLKRQDLLIEAARHLQSPVKILIAGDGGQFDYYQSLIDKYDLNQKVRLTGRFQDDEKFALYARALAVFFAPFDEDYGYITLEAMLSGKPVITCTDSGGPLEFVEHERTGFILDPDPVHIAAHIDRLYNDKIRARQMGAEGRQVYADKKISWANVIEQLLE